MKIRLHAFEPGSRANGPGLRAVIWMQGCSLGCPECFNPGSHDLVGGSEADTLVLANRILSGKPRVEGISISGGEPFQQPNALLDLLTRLDGAGLSRLVFSGYTLREIKAQTFGPPILEHLDVVIAGRYVASQYEGKALLGSANQKIHLLTPRHRPEEFGAVPTSEVILHPDGSITLTGIRPLRLPS